MLTEEKIKETRRLLGKGVPEGELKEDLTKEGYSKEDIAKIFAPQPYDMRSWYLFFGILFLLGGLWLFLKTVSYFMLALSARLFFQYYRETERLKKKGERV